MANQIRIKRSTTTAVPTSLANAELAYSENSSKLFIGVGSGGAGGSASQIVAIGGDGAYLTLDSNGQIVSGNKTFTGSLTMSGATIDGLSTTGNVTVGGDLVVNGTTTTINSTVVTVDDKLVELGSTASPSDAGADGGGIVLKGTTDKSIKWYDATDSWTFNQSVELEAGNSYRIDGTEVLSKTSLGSGVTGSSLTGVGTLTSGSLGTGFTTVATAQGGTGQTSYAAGELLIGNNAGGLSKANLTAGTGISITNGNGAITITAQETLSAGDGLDLDGGVFSVDLKANGGLVIESTELAVDLGASSITGTLGVSKGGTGATTQADARSNLGLVIGTDVQAYNANYVVDASYVHTDNNFTTALKNKLDGVEAGAEVNVQADWTEANSGSDAFILNKPVLGTASAEDVGYFATAAQGSLADSALQSGDIGVSVQAYASQLDSLSGLSSGAASALALLTQSEVEILDGATVSTAELNVIDGSTSATATTLALADRFVVNDGGAMVQVALSDLVAFFEDGTASGFDLDGGTF